MNKPGHPTLWISFLVLVLAVSFYLFDSLSSIGQPAVEPLKVGLATDLYPLVGEALNKNYFAKVYLDVKIHKYHTGTQALASLFANEVDVAIVGIGPIVKKTLEHKEFRILSSLATFTDLYQIVGRRDKGINSPSDLKQHTVAISDNATMRYFLENYLLEYGMTPQDVNLVLVDNVTQLPDLFLKGEVDAFCARDPFISQVVDKLADQAVVFKSRGLPSNILNLVSLESIVSRRPDLLRRFLLGMIRLEESMAESGPLLPGNQASYRINLGQELVIQLENHARWLLARHQPRPAMPNFTAYITPGILHGVAPERVTLIH